MIIQVLARIYFSSTPIGPERVGEKRRPDWKNHYYSIVVECICQAINIYLFKTDWWSEAMFSDIIRTMDCLFCRISNKELPAEIVGETEELLAFNDIHPSAPIHVLIVPKRHIPSIADLTPEDEALAGKMLYFAKELAETLQVADDGYRLVFNVRHHGGQIIDHLHLHLLAGQRLGPETRT